METESQQKMVNQLLKSKNALKNWQREVERINTTTHEDKVVAVRDGLETEWKRYVSYYDNLLEINPPIMNTLIEEHSLEIMKKLEYDKKIDELLVLLDVSLFKAISPASSIHSVVRRVNDSRPNATGSISSKSNTSNVSNSSIRSRAKKAERAIQQAKFELEIATQKAEVKTQLLQARLDASIKIDKAVEELDNLECMSVDSDNESVLNDKTIISNYSLDFNRQNSLGQTNTVLKPVKTEIVTPQPISPVVSDTTALHEALLAIQKLSVAHELPTPEVIKFNGKATEYPRFISRFNELVLDKPLTETQKMTRLLQFLSGPALCAVQGYEMTGPGKLKKSLQKLQDRFGEPHIIVEACIKEITKGKPVKQGNALEFREFADKVRSARETLAYLNCLSELNNDHLVAIRNRLPKYCWPKWRNIASKLRDKNKKPSIDDMLSYLEREAKALCDPVFGLLDVENDSIAVEHNIKPKQDVAKVTTMATMTALNESIPKANAASCVLCQQNHLVKNCKEFKDLSHDDRIKIVKENMLCFRCLKQNHIAKNCYSKVKCEVQNCNGRHVTALHPPEQQVATYVDRSPQGTELESSAAVSTSSTSSCHATGKENARGETLLQVVPVKVYGPKDCIEVYALLDSASNVNLCEEWILDKLNLKGKENAMKLTTVTGNSERKASKLAELSLSKLSSTTSTLKLDSVWSIDNLNISSNAINGVDTSKWEHLKGISFPKIASEKVSILIGTKGPIKE